MRIFGFGKPKSPTLFRVVTMSNIESNNANVAEAVIDFNNYALGLIVKDPQFTLLQNTYTNLKIIPHDVPHVICGRMGIDIMNDPVKWIASQTGLTQQDIISLNGLRLFMIKGTGDLQNTRVQYSVAYYSYKDGFFLIHPSVSFFAEKLTSLYRDIIQNNELLKAIVLKSGCFYILINCPYHKPRKALLEKIISFKVLFSQTL